MLCELRKNLSAKWFLLMLFPMVLPTQAWSEDLNELLQLATKYDAKYLAASHNYKAVAENPVIAQAELYPKVAFQIDKSETDQDIVRADNPLFAGGRTRYPTDSYLLTLEQPLFNWQTFKRIEQADAELIQAGTELQEAKQDLIIRVSEAYFTVLAARNGLALVQTEKSVVAKHVEQANEQLERGFAGRPDVADAQARLAIVGADEIEIRNQMQDSIQALVELTSYQPESIEDLDINAPMQTPIPDDIEGWVELTLSQNPSLHARQQAVEIAKQEVRRRAAADYPTLDLIARYGKRDAGGAIFGGDGTEVDTTELLLSLNIPIYQGERVSAQIRQAAELLGVALAEEEQARRTLARKTRAAFLSIKNAVKRAAALQEAVRAQEVALEAKRAGFEKGVFSSIDVLDAEKILTEAKTEYEKARYEYFLNRLRLQQATGGDEEDLQQINGLLTRTVSLLD